MIIRATQRLKQKLYAPLCRGVLATPPIRTADDGVVLFSMIGSAVLIPYLVAVKSLHHHLRRGRVALLDDGTLTAEDRAVLAHHLGQPEIFSILDVDVGPCPTGGTWERLLSILDLRAKDYVIQLDSDTVTVGPVPEVEAAIDANVCFTLLGAEGDIEEILPVGEFSRRYFPGGAPRKEDFAGHIQGASESILTDICIPGLPHPLYVRGCSGFAGFARGGDRALATAFSQAACAKLGEARWAEWGTEQVTSSFVIANEAGSRVLPPGRYTNFWDTPPPADSRMIHFVGSYRYRGFEYFRRSRAAIRAMRRPEPIRREQAAFAAQARTAP